MRVGLTTLSLHTSVRHTTMYPSSSHNNTSPTCGTWMMQSPLAASVYSTALSSVKGSVDSIKNRGSATTNGMRDEQCTRILKKIKVWNHNIRGRRLRGFRWVIERVQAFIATGHTRRTGISTPPSELRRRKEDLASRHMSWGF